jgi:hypothetical protein
MILRYIEIAVQAIGSSDYRPQYYISNRQLYPTMGYNNVWQLFKFRKGIYIYVRIQIKVCCFLENIVSCERPINIRPTFGHEMAAGNDVVN